MSCRDEFMKTKDMKVKLLVGGKNVGMVSFVHDAFRDMIIAFVKNLKGHEGGKIEIVIE